MQDCNIHGVLAREITQFRTKSMVLQIYKIMANESCLLIYRFSWRILDTHVFLSVSTLFVTDLSYCTAVLSHRCPCKGICSFNTGHGTIIVAENHRNKMGFFFLWYVSQSHNLFVCKITPTKSPKSAEVVPRMVTFWKSSPKRSWDALVVCWAEPRRLGPSVCMGIPALSAWDVRAAIWGSRRLNDLR